MSKAAVIILGLAVVGVGLVWPGEDLGGPDSSMESASQAPRLEIGPSDFPDGSDWILLNVTLAPGVIDLRVRSWHDAPELVSERFRSQCRLESIDGASKAAWVRPGRVAIYASQAGGEIVSFGNPMDAGLLNSGGWVGSVSTIQTLAVLLGVEHVHELAELSAGYEVRLPENTLDWEIVADGKLSCGSRLADFPQGDHLSTPFIGTSTGLTTRYRAENSLYGLVLAYTDLTADVRLAGPGFEWSWNPTPSPLSQRGSTWIQELGAGDWTLHANITGSQDYSAAWIFADLPAWATQMAIDREQR